MAAALVAIVVVIGAGAGALALIGIPVLFGVMMYDMIQNSRAAAPSRATAPSAVSLDMEGARTRIAVERGVARAFVIAGGLFWSAATFAGLYSFQETGASSAFMGAFIPLAAVTATLIVGWYYERVTAALLLIASFAVVAWGVIYQFETGVWMLTALALIGPMVTASVLFWLARGEQEAYERVTAESPDLALVFAAKSSL